VNFAALGLVIDVRPVFAWYDIWVGMYFDRRSGYLYVLPLPMVGIKVGVWRAL
jgi:hypothetical protein